MLTPKGWVNIEDIRVGDSVVTPKNTIETVMGVYPQGVVDIYRVTFQDGRTVDCCGEHLWQWSRDGGASFVETTKTIKNRLLGNQPIYLPTASILRQEELHTIQTLFDKEAFPREEGGIWWYTGDKEKVVQITPLLQSGGYCVEIDTNVVKVYGKHLSHLFTSGVKKTLCVDTHYGLRVDNIKFVGKDEATCIAITGEDKLFLTTNYVVTHNTILALFKVLPWINDPDYKAVFVRQSSTQLRQGGGLWEEAKSVFRHYGAYFKEQQLQAVFPSGATVYFKVLGRDAEIYNFDGGQYTMIFVDEAQHHTQLQVMYLASRLRSKSKAPHQLICTCNPLKTSFLMKFVQYSLDDEGIPIRSLAPKQRYYAEYAGDLVFADTAEEMLEKYPSVIPMTYAFHPATVEDNPIIKKRNPDYINRLKNMNRVDKLRLYYGSWYASADADKYWKRDWVGDVIDYIPPDVQIVSRVRAWDLAASPEPTASSVNRDPDWTAGVLISRDRMGTYYVEDVVRFRRTSNEVLQAVINQAFVDGDGVQVVIPRDAGAGGVGFHAFMIRSLAEHGIAARTAKVSGHSGKLQRFLPFASMCENGQVKILRGDWNDHYFDELENFIGGGREQKSHDDGAYTYTKSSLNLSNSVEPLFVKQDNTERRHHFGATCRDHPR